MGVSEAALEIILKARDEASKTVKGAGGALESLGGIAAGIATGGLALAAAAVVGIGTACVRLGVGIANLAIDAAPLQNISESFDRITEASGISGDVMMTALQDATAGMIPASDLMTLYNEAAMKAGETLATQLPEALGYMSQIAAATGGDLQAMADRYTEAIGGLQPAALEQMGIQVDLKSLNEQYAASLGLTADELTKEQQQAALAAEAMRQLQEKTAGLPEVQGTATQQLAAFQTTIADTKDGIGLGFVPALAELLKPLNEIVSGVGPKLVEWAGIAGEWLGEKVPKAVEWLKAKWDELWPDLWNATQQLLRDAQPVWEWLRKEFGDFTTTILPWLQDAWGNLQRGWAEITGVWNRDLKPALDDLARALGLGGGGASDFGEIMGNLAGSVIWANLKSAIDIVKFGLEMFKLVIEGVTGAIDAISRAIDWFKQQWEAIQNIQLPDWLTPGSATPFELGLRGIAEAIQGLPAMPQLAFAPAMAGGGMAAPMAGGAGLGGVTYYITNQFGPGSVRSDDDIEEIARRQEQILVHRGVRSFEV